MRSGTQTGNQESNVSGRDDWLGADQLRMFTERLHPQQWLGPSNIAWVRFDVPVF